MGFESILFDGFEEDQHQEISEAPAFFRDLNLDQLIAAVTADWEEYDLTDFYSIPPNRLETITYRQEVMRDLEDDGVMQSLKRFSAQFQLMRKYLQQSKTLTYKNAKERWFLDAIDIYCDAAQGFSRDLLALKLDSRGLRAFCEYLEQYCESSYFRRLVAESKKLSSDLSMIRVRLRIKNGAVTVSHYDGENDYSTAVERTFEKFRSGTTRAYSIKKRNREGLNHIQTQILDRVAMLHPEIFRTLEAFCILHAGYLDKRISKFDREIQFYVSYLTYIDKLRGAGLNFCLPILSQTSKAVSARDGFDLVLADKLIREGGRVVCNDFSLSGSERILVVSGPNQGGKTTYARMFGQLHYLASLGCPVPGSEAQLFLFDRLFAHFEQEENIANLRGKLQDDLVRIRTILDEATPNSILIMNEIFSSTTLSDAIYLGKQILARLSALDVLVVCVTFLDELASFSDKTVSVVSQVNPENPALRSFKLVRKPADGLAYALAIAQKYRVTYDCVTERIKV
jgi:DNA mismatch repair ATPase MutS